MKTTPGRPLIELDDVTKVYGLGQTEVRALQEVSLSIREREMVAVMGRSGSGKSTLMNIVGCLDVPTSGSYHLDSENVVGMSDDRLAEIRSRKVGFVFQTYNLLPRLTAMDNVALPLMYGGRGGGRKRSASALEKVGLAARARHRPTELSGGEQQRVGIARALVKDPAILLADEPTGNLDSATGNEIMSVIARLNRDDGLTVVFVTHDPDVARHAQRVVSMEDGRVVDDRAARER